MVYGDDVVVDETGMLVETELEIEEVTDEESVDQASTEVDEKPKKKSKKEPELERNGKVTTLPVDADPVDSDYPNSIPQGEGVDPLASGVKIPNVDQ